MSKKNIKMLLYVAALFCVACVQTWGAGSVTYPWPTNWSLGGLASWSQPLIASGTVLPSAGNGSAGDLYILIDGATMTWYRHDGSDFKAMAGGSGGGGTTDHSALTNLAYADAGHTGFASTTTVTDHMADTTDPHGATPEFSGGLVLGAGTPDATITRTATSTLTLASYTVIAPTAATPTATIATGTLWYDSNVNKLKCYDGSAWQALW